MAEVELEALRKEVTDLIKLQRRTQELGWEHMVNDVHAAREKVTDMRLALIEKRLQELAVSNYPTMLESVLGLLVTFIPVSRIVQGLSQHFARSFQLFQFVGFKSRELTGGITKTIKRPASHEAAKFYRDLQKYRPDVFALVKGRRQWVDNIVEYDQTVLKFTTLYAPEIEDSLRGLAKSAASALAKPIVGQVEMFSTKAAPQRAKSSTDATDFLKQVRDWIARSKIADLAAYDELQEAVAKSTDKDHIESVKTLMSFNETPASRRLKSYDREAFQRFVEVCIWCTTWDFTPRFHPTSRGRTIATAGFTPAHFQLPPLGNDFWRSPPSATTTPSPATATRPTWRSAGA